MDDAARWFLREVFGNFVDAQHQMRLLWLPSGRSAGFAEVDDAPLRFLAAGVEAEQDVYVAAGLYRPVTRGRGSDTDVTSILGLWADVDVAKGAGTPTTRDEAHQGLIRSVAQSPTLIISSGHGLQPWWLFQEPLEVEEGAATLLRRWGATLQGLAQQKGWTLDPVWDLARVLRVPGAVNFSRNKGGEPVPTGIYWPENPAERLLVHHDWRDLEADTIPEQHLPAAATTVIPIQALETTHDLGDITRRAWQLCEVDVRFKKTWLKKRTDLSDQSQSEYDLALAHLAVAASFTDQEIADLLRAFRRYHGADEGKLDRTWANGTRSYLTQTVGKARSAQQRRRSLGELSRVEAPTVGGDAAAEEHRTEVLDHLSKVFHVRIARWLKHGVDEPAYVLVLADGREVYVGPPSNVTNQTRFRDALYGAVGDMPDRVKQHQWDPICRALASIEELVADEQATKPEKFGGLVAEYLQDQLSAKADSEDDGWKVLFMRRGPFYRDGELHVHFHDLRRYLKRTGYEVPDSQLKEMFRAAGFVGRKFCVRQGTQVMSRYYMVGPAIVQPQGTPAGMWAELESEDADEPQHEVGDGARRSAAPERAAAAS